jgi:uncharacterized membrane protein YphA (DoxX/SURF4 family)
MQTTESDLKVISPAIGITARILFTLIFFLSGITHFTSMQSYIDLMPAPIPFRAFWVAISGVVELCGAAMILFNYRPRLGAWLIVLFLVPVTIVVHGTAMITLPDQVRPRDDRLRPVHYSVRRQRHRPSLIRFTRIPQSRSRAR